MPVFYKILIPDGESNLVIKVLRCLSDIDNIRVFMLSSKKDVPAKHSRYVEKFYHRPEISDPLKWIQVVNEIVGASEIDVILPTQAWAIRRFLEYEDQVLFRNKLLLPPSLDIFDMAEDKGQLSRYLNQINIPCPKSWIVSKLDQDPGFLKSLDYPVLYKPNSKLGGGKGFIKFDNSRCLGAFLCSDLAADEVYLQQFIEGKDLGFNAICKKGEILAYTIQLGILFDKDPYKPQIGLKMIEEKNILQSMTQLIKSLGWSGVLHIDFIYNETTGEYGVLEINPRFWLTVQASSFAGVNFPWLYCETVLNGGFNFPAYEKIEYFTLKGLEKKILESPGILLRPSYIWNHTPVKYVLRDPKLFVLLIWKHLFGKGNLEST